jgi:nucleotide exchange factor SIL1
MVKSDSIEEGIKALYAVSALTRNNLASQELFYAEAGGLMLQVTYLSFNNIVNIVIFF